MLGENELVKLFPDFKDLVQPSGIDLALDKIYIQESEGSLIACLHFKTPYCLSCFN